MSIDIEHIRTRVAEIGKDLDYVWPQETERDSDKLMRTVITRSRQALSTIDLLLAERDASHAAGVREGLERAAETVKDAYEYAVEEANGDNSNDNDFSWGARANECGHLLIAIRALITPTETKTDA